MKRIPIYFGGEQQKQFIMEQVLKDTHADYRVLQDAGFNQCIANLMGLPRFNEMPDTKPAHHSIDLMLFEDASDEETQKVNECLQAEGTTMQRRATLTKHNKDWTFHDLLSEIEREHIYFQTMDITRTLLIQSSEPVTKAYTPAFWEPYEQAFYQAYECMNRECSMKELDGTYKALSSTEKLFEPTE